MDWSTQLQMLQALDRAQAFADLSKSLCHLPPPPPEAAGDLAYWRGKCAVVDNRYAEAIAPLAHCVLLQPQRSHAHYLLGLALARCGLWPDAVAATQRALDLEPGLQAAALELAQAQLALGDSKAAQRALEPWAAMEGLDRHMLYSVWKARVRSICLRQAPALIAQALSSPQRLNDALLHEWLQVAGGLLLAGQWSLAGAWCHALAEPSPSVEACSNPLPRRLALLLGIVLSLLDPNQADSFRPEELRSCFWLPPAHWEQQLWAPLIVPVLHLLIGRRRDAVTPEPAEAERLELLAQALDALAPPDDTLVQELVAGLRPIAGGMTASAPSGLEPLQQFSSDLPRLLELWPVVLAQDDAQLQRRRGDLDQALAQLSDLVLDRPNRLVVHPDSQTQELALQLRREGLALLMAAHQRLAGLLPALPPHPRPRRRWLLLATDDLPQCFLYRVEQKRQQLEVLGCECRIVLREALNNWDWSENLLWADAVIVCRLPALHPVLRAIQAARQAGLLVLYDIDDLIVDPEHSPPPLATYGGTLNPQLHRRFQLDVPLFAEAIRACDGLIASTTALAQRWRQINADPVSVQVLPNLAPPELRRALQPPRSLAPEEPLHLVVASGTTAHKQAWQQELAPALARLMEHHPRLRLDLLGHLQLPLVLQPHADRIRCRPFADYPRYLQQLGQSAIGLVVLEPGVFTDAKSAIRWMEFSYLGLASVLTPTATYLEILEPDVHALFARGSEQWVEQLEVLITDPLLRLQLARRAQAHALRLFGPQQAERFWQPWIQAHVPVAAGRRLLVPHVFYAPQLMGGATRVVLDQLRALQEQAGERWEITVLCSDHTPWQCSSESAPEPWCIDTPVPVQIHAWHGLRVVRLALKPRPWREHHDVAVERLCRWWLAQEGFDLIHAHCLQVLSAAPLQVASELGIPYAITLHDGWWISPRQFLITASGASVDPADPLGHYDVPSHQPAELLERDRARRNALKELLARAAARWAVSEAFAELHHQAGIENVTVMSNRWQPMAASIPREVRPAGLPLRACFIGGLSLHKGLAVLQAAVLQARLPEPGLSLTLVDASLPFEATYTLHWGTVPVQVVPAVPMQAMAAFYAEHDLLLAPSIWPESYGLVTREALSAGLWVVASDCGALAEPIRHGINGHVVPPGDAAALADLLERLCRDHPTPQPLLSFNTAEWSLGLELEQRYRQLLGWV